MARPRILLTNDDGINAEGLHALRAAVASLGDVMVVAPEGQRSAIGHSITLTKPIRVRLSAPSNGAVVYACDGTPADCVMVGVYGLAETPPDLVISGINEGANMGEDLTYSGTVCAAMEAAIHGVPAFAISSLLDPLTGKATYESAARVAHAFAEMVLSERMPQAIARARGGAFLNINVPSLPPAEIAGIELTVPGVRCYDLRLKRTDISMDEILFEAKGGPIDDPNQPGTDVAAVVGGRISVTPITYDLVVPTGVADEAQWGFDGVMDALDPVG